MRRGGGKSIDGTADGGRLMSAVLAKPVSEAPVEGWASEVTSGALRTALLALVGLEVTAAVVSVAAAAATA